MEPNSGAGTPTPTKKNRGFAAMDPDKQRAIASQGGKTAHTRGTAHRFSPAEAAKAGKKGGMARHNRTSVVKSVHPTGGIAGQVLPNDEADVDRGMR